MFHPEFQQALDELEAVAQRAIYAAVPVTVPMPEGFALGIFHGDRHLPTIDEFLVDLIELQGDDGTTTAALGRLAVEVSFDEPTTFS